RDPQPGRRRRVVVLEPRKHALDLLLCVAERRRMRVGLDADGHELVMQRRDEHLHAVLPHELDAVEQVLLRQQPPGRPPRRGAGEVVDELVDAGSTEGGGGAAGEETATGELHVLRFGLISTGELSSRWMYCTTLR